MRLAAALAFVLAQTAPFVETIEVRIHNVDVIVTDQEGNAVHGLRKDDFELLEDGKPQTITNFAEYAEMVDRRSRLSTEQGQAGLPVLHAPPPRKLVFFVDHMSVHPQTRGRLAKNAAELLGKTMREGDEAVVIRPAAPDEKIALDFIGDRDAVRAALKSAIDESTHRTNVAFTAEMRRFKSDAQHAVNPKDLRKIARRHASYVKRRVDNRLAVLRAIVATLAPLEGRKVLVTVTESLPAQPGREFFDFLTGDEMITAGSFDTPSDFLDTDYVDMRPAIADLARLASANGITIYGLQPEYDLRIEPPGGEVSVKQVHRAMGNTAETLHVLTEKTGGKWFVGDARVDDALRTIERDVQSYYSLAYRAGDALDQAHKVEVRVRNRPELIVRARNEVTRRSPKRDMSDRIVAALVTAKVPNEIGARASAPAKEKGRGRYSVDVDVGVQIGKLTLLRDGNVYRGKFTVHYAVSGKDSDFVSGVEPEQVVEIPAAEVEAARAKVWRHTLHMNIDKGQHQVAVGILDGVSHASGMATLAVEVK